MGLYDMFYKGMVLALTGMLCAGCAVAWICVWRCFEGTAVGKIFIRWLKMHVEEDEDD